MKRLAFVALAACSAPAHSTATPAPETGAPATPDAAAARTAAPAPAPDAAPPRELAYPATSFVAAQRVKLGKARIDVTPCRLDVPIDADVRVAHHGGGLAVDTQGRVYVLAADGVVRRFRLEDPCDLRMDDSFAPITVPARDQVTGLSVDAGDTLYVMRFNQKTLAIAPDGTQTEICGNIDDVRTEPGAAATIVDGRKVTRLDAACEGPEIELEGWGGGFPSGTTWPFGDGFAYINFLGDNEPIDYQRIGIHTLDGKKQVFVGSSKEGPGQICGVDVVWSCGGGICAGDWGCSTLRVWKRSGKLVGAVSSRELVGLTDARPIDAVTVGDASLMLIAASVDLSDTEYVYYPLIVRIDGLPDAVR